MQTAVSSSSSFIHVRACAHDFLNNALPFALGFRLVLKQRDLHGWNFDWVGGVQKGLEHCCCAIRQLLSFPPLNQQRNDLPSHHYYYTGPGKTVHVSRKAGRQTHATLKKMNLNWNCEDVC